jgi:hypothetical protein
MENQIIQYFKGERYESLIFLAAGAAAIAAAAYFLLKQKTPFHFGLSTGIVAIGLIQIVVGYSVYSRTEAQVMELKNLYENDKSAYVALEEPRMDKVMKNFVIYRWVEIGLIVAGLLVMFIPFFSAYMKGLAAGLFLQSLLMLGLDYFAEKRGKEYTEVVQIMKKDL